MIHVSIRERSAAAKATEPITAGSVGMEARFRFSEDWEGLGRTAVFRGSGQSVDAALLSDRCTVPHEVLRSAGGRLKIGVYGSGDQGQRVTPTVWADAGPIREGAAPSEIPSTPASQSLAQQLLEAAQAARTIAQGVRDEADAGAFDGEKGDKGDKGDPGNTGAAGKAGNSIWRTTKFPTSWNAGGTIEYRYETADLSGRSPVSLVVGDLIIRSSVMVYFVKEVLSGACYVTLGVSIKGAPGAPGDDYVLTAADKAEIVSEVLDALPVWTGGSY